MEKLIFHKINIFQASHSRRILGLKLGFCSSVSFECQMDFPLEFFSISDFRMTEMHFRSLLDTLDLALTQAALLECVE